MKGFVTPATLANQVRMLRTQFSGTCLFVEGDTDVRLYGNLMDRTTCKLIPSLSRDNAIGALQILEGQEVRGVLSIVDADFTRLKEQSFNSSNLLLTDTHDLETMMLHSPALDKLLAEFCSEEKLNKFQERHGSIRDHLFKSVFLLGLLRFHSLETQLHLTFSNLSFNKFLTNELTLDVRKMFADVKNNSKNKSFSDEEVAQTLDGLSQCGFDHSEVCCGHDLMEVLSHGLRKILGTNNSNDVKPEILERSLRLAYEFEFFRQTSLYTDILTWQERNTPYKVIA